MRDQNCASYFQRNSILKHLGFDTYTDYLASDMWKQVKAEAYSTYGNKCFLCLGKAWVVHHHKYTLKNLNGRSVKSLFPLCHACHEHIEIKPDGTKRMLWEVKTFFGSLKLQFPERSKQRRRQQKKRKRLIGRI